MKNLLRSCLLTISLLAICIGTVLAVPSVSTIHSFFWNESNYNDPLNEGKTPERNNLLYYDGRMYGMTVYGGDNDPAGGSGIIFSCLPDGTDYTVLHEFSVNNNGYRPSGSLIEVNGQLYGLTKDCASGSHGTLFRIDTDGGSYTVLHTFSTGGGYYPEGALLYYNNKLWGMTTLGGTDDAGIVFSYNLLNTVYTTVYNFDYSEDGGEATGGLVQYGGLLYGMTKRGNGNCPDGCIFSINPANNVFTRLYRFTSTTGGDNFGDLVVLNDKLYGMSYSGGGDGVGTIFYYDPILNNNTVTVIRDFAWTGCYGPYGSLLVYNNQLWGLTLNHFNGNGGMFSINPNGTGYTENYTFPGTGSLPRSPMGSLIYYNGYLYAMSSSGGASSDGTIFRYGSFGALASVTTNTVTNIQPATAACGGNVTSDGGAEVTARGVVWSATDPPVLTSNELGHTTNSSGTGTFTSSISGLTASTTYYVRAYATNSIGTVYGTSQTFTSAAPSANTPTMSEWALIALGGLALAFGARFVMKLV